MTTTDRVVADLRDAELAAWRAPALDSEVLMFDAAVESVLAFLSAPLHLPTVDCAELHLGIQPRLGRWYFNSKGKSR